jgi:hypothetical protein
MYDTVFIRGAEQTPGVRDLYKLKVENFRKSIFKDYKVYGMKSPIVNVHRFGSEAISMSSGRPGA